MSNGSVTLLRNRRLSDADTGGQTSTVGEPSLANNGQQIFLTGNWYATRSLDDGGSWSFLSPFDFPPPAPGGFCCDQTVLYDPGQDILVWLLQYVKTNNTNTLRVAVKVGATLDNDDWFWWDFRPEATNPEWRGEWFDYNHAALSDNFLYVASNAFRVSDDVWTRSVVFRLPLAELAAGQQLTFEHFQSTENFSLRCTQGAAGTMYLASHNSNNQLRLFAWPENENRVAQFDIRVSRWSAGRYSARGPDGANWLTRCDPRITGAWVANGVIGLMWSANKSGSRPFPFVRVVRIDEASKSVIDEPDIWNDGFAYAYPDAYPNAAGVVGVTLFRGGGNRHPGHVVGFRDEAQGRWVLTGTRDGTHGPGDGKWGDYLTCRRHAPEDGTWIAVGYTLQGGGTRNNVEPQYVHFGA